MGYSGYYMLGYRLLHFDVRVPTRRATLALVDEVAVTAAGTHALSVRAASPCIPCLTT